jgi:hypothetical protein
VQCCSGGGRDATPPALCEVAVPHSRVLFPPLGVTPQHSTPLHALPLHALRDVEYKKEKKKEKKVATGIHAPQAESSWRISMGVHRARYLSLSLSLSLSRGGEWGVRSTRGCRSAVLRLCEGRPHSFEGCCLDVRKTERRHRTVTGIQKWCGEKPWYKGDSCFARKVNLSTDSTLRVLTLQGRSLSLRPQLSSPPRRARRAAGAQARSSKALAVGTHPRKLLFL